MRKIVSWVLLGLGSFLLVAAIVAVTWAGDRVERTPLDTDSTTHLEGTATVLPAGPGDYAIRATSFTRADSDASDDTVIVWENHSCLVLDIPDTPDCGEQGVGDDADPNVVSISSDYFATDRNTGIAVTDGDYLPEDVATEHEGLVNKFPFRHREEGLRLLGRHHRADRPGDLRGHRGDRRARGLPVRDVGGRRAGRDRRRRRGHLQQRHHDVGRAQDRRHHRPGVPRRPGGRRDAGARHRDGVHRRPGGRLRRRRRGQHLPDRPGLDVRAAGSASSAVRS